MSIFEKRYKISFFLDSVVGSDQVIAWMICRSIAGRVQGFFAQKKRMTSYLHLLLRSKMSEGIPLLVLYAFMVWTGQLYFFIKEHLWTHFSRSSCLSLSV
jgi:uncharacterized membrane protein